jgi:hypothetical protein
MEQEELIIQAMDKTVRFGIPRTKPDFDAWYNENLWGWFRQLSDEGYIEALREMPWNERTN